MKNHLIFKEEDKYLESSGIMNDWPKGRGAYISKNEQFVSKVNLLF